MVQPTDSLFLNSSIPPPPLRHSFNVPFSLASRTPPFSHVSRNCYGSPIARCPFSVGRPLPHPLASRTCSWLGARRFVFALHVHLRLLSPHPQLSFSPQQTVTTKATAPVQLYPASVREHSHAHPRAFAASPHLIDVTRFHALTLYLQLSHSAEGFCAAWQHSTTCRHGHDHTDSPIQPPRTRT
jgi:hypothetical protein